MQRDAVGRKLEPGTILAYPVMRDSKLILSMAVVEEINEDYVIAIVPHFDTESDEFVGTRTMVKRLDRSVTVDPLALYVHLPELDDAMEVDKRMYLFRTSRHVKYQDSLPKINFDKEEE